MCGIVAGNMHGSVIPLLLNGLAELEYRGYDSAGVAVRTKDGIRTIKTAGRVEALERAVLADSTFTGHTGIAHTRWATHGAPDERNAHPHSSMHGKYTIVHNGIIENHRPLREQLLKHGYTFHSETDSEVVANLLEYYDTGDPMDTLRKVCAKLQGSFAFCILYRDEPDYFYCARYGSPLLLGIREDGICAASDLSALGNCTILYRMGDMEFARCTKEKIVFYQKDGTVLAKSPEPLTTLTERADKDGFDTFMEKEMHEQPLAVARTLQSPMVAIAELPDKIYLVGCGSAFHAASFGAYLLEAHLHIPCVAVPASEFRYNPVSLDHRTLAVFISQSGETADTLAALRKAKSMGAKTLSVVNTAHSSLAVESGYTFLTSAGREIAVATTKAYTAQLVALCRLACRLAPGTALPTVLETLPQKVKEALVTKEDAKRLAEKYRGQNSIYFIGRGPDYPSAMEGALKLRELSYIDAHAYPAGELKHGTISLIRPGTLCVAVACMNSVADKMISNIEELRARGANVLCITTKSLRPRIPADDFLVVPDADPAVLPCLSVIPMQFFAHFAAKCRNCDIDKPRNLAKSVTVE